MRTTRRHVMIAATFVFAAVSFTQVAYSQEIKAGKYDNGLMWTFDFPPTEHIAETHGFSPDDAWFEKARLGALRLPNCTASFVSSNGLVMTNHHCGRGSVAAVTREGEQLLDNGFMAVDLADERTVDGLYVDQLVDIKDVTDEVYAALDGMETDAEKASARQEAIATITQRVTEEAGGEGFVVQVINLYQGGKYSAYTFKRFSDLRLVMAPELQIGYFGGDTDNFTYPRYALDVTFFRVYENNEPYQPEHYFKWSSDGVKSGDAVFVVGNPGSTNRLETVEQLRWRGDVSEKAILKFVRTRIAALEKYYEEAPSDALKNQIFGLKNTEKLYTGRVKGLNDATIMARRADSQNTFDKDLSERFAEAATPDLALAIPNPTFLDDIAEIQQQKREFTNDFRSFFALQPGQALSSAIVRRSFLALTYVREAAVEGAGAEQMKEQLLSIADHPESLERNYFRSRISDWQSNFGEDNEMVEKAFAGRSVDSVVDKVLAESALRSQAALDAAIAAGELSEDDPMLQLVAPFAERQANYQSGYAGLLAQETELNAQHGRAQFEIYGTQRPPDATFSLRIADGIVKPYDYNGTEAPVNTTFFGMYDRHYSNPGNPEWALPERWKNPPASFDMSTPVNLVSTNDIIGGNSGSPLLNKDLEVVGLVFDGNIESLPSAFIYNTDTGRTVSVDARGILEAIDEVYDMDRIAVELTQGTMVATEAAADAM